MIATKEVATLALSAAHALLEIAEDAVEGPIRDALKYAVDFAVDLVPFDVKRISFNTLLSTADGGRIGLSIDFEFCGTDRVIDFEFNFRSLDPEDIILGFAQALAEKIMDVQEEDTRSGAKMITASGASGKDNPVSPPITKEYLQSLQEEAEEEDRAFQEEMENEAIDFDVSKIELKRHLINVQLQTLTMRESLLEQQKAAAEETKEIIVDVETLVTNETNALINARSAQTLEISNAFEKAKDVFLIIEQRSRVHTTRVQTISEKLRGIHGRIAEEERNAEVAAASRNLMGALSEEEEQKENQKATNKCFFFGLEFYELNNK